jgi:hypothetical protein
MGLGIAFLRQLFMLVLGGVAVVAIIVLILVTATSEHAKRGSTARDLPPDWRQRKKLSSRDATTDTTPDR